MLPKAILPLRLQKLNRRTPKERRNRNGLYSYLRNPFRSVSTGISNLPTSTFAIPFSAKKQGCGPEARALRGKSIGGKRNPLGDPPVLPQEEAGHRTPSHAKRVTPLHRNTPVLRERTACPPGPRNEVRLMVFARNPPMADFRAGQCLKFNRSCAYLAKSEGGQGISAEKC